MSKPRLFLVAPEVIAGATFTGIITAAAKAGDCACLLVSESIEHDAVQAVQALGLAVLLRNSEPRMMHRVKADGLHIDKIEGVKDLRLALTSESLGVFANVSRHIAMEAAEVGADYVAFAQAHQYAGEPIIGWWQAVTDVPAVAFDPVEPKDLATLLPQTPDFIRPSDAMWQSVEEATRVIGELMAAMA
jgi:thiamine-phosphate pyrophosphorylase